MDARARDGIITRTDGALRLVSVHGMGVKLLYSGFAVWRILKTRSDVVTCERRTADSTRLGCRQRKAGRRRAQTGHTRPGNAMTFQLLHTGFETCFAPQHQTPAPKVPAAKHISNPDFGAVLTKESDFIICILICISICILLARNAL